MATHAATLLDCVITKHFPYCHSVHPKESSTFIATSEIDAGEHGPIMAAACLMIASKFHGRRNLTSNDFAAAICVETKELVAWERRTLQLLKWNIRTSSGE